jgi:hypothetical protein
MYTDMVFGLFVLNILTRKENGMNVQKTAERVCRFMKREKVVDVGEATRRIFKSMRYYSPRTFGEVCQSVRKMQTDRQLPLL